MSVELSEGETNEEQVSPVLDLPFDFPPGLRPYDPIPTIESTHEVNYYAVLGITSSANRVEIHTAFNNMAKYYHPDRLNRLLAKHPIQDPETFKAKCGEIFHLITQAWNILGDNQKRPDYDFRNNFIYDIDLKQKFRTKKELAQTAIENMIMSSTMIDKEECAAGRYGLYITEAYYGVLKQNIKPNESIQNTALGPYENVRIPVVNLIHNHKIMVRPSSSYMSEDTLSDLPGFYDMSPGQNKYLIIRYEYNQEHHQVVVSDNGTIEIPKREHIVKNYKNSKRKRKTKKSETKIIKTHNNTINLFYILSGGFALYCLFSVFRFFRRN